MSPHAATHAILDQLPLPVVELDPARRVRFANRAAAVAAGDAAEALVGTRLREGPLAGIWREDLTPSLDRAARTRRTARTLVTARGGGRQEATVEPAFDADGALVSLTIVAHVAPPTAATADASARLRALLDALPHGVLAIDAATGVITEANVAAAELVGLPRAILAGLRPPYPFGELLAPLPRAEAALRAVRMLRRPDGELRPVLVEHAAAPPPGLRLVVLHALARALPPAAPAQIAEASALVAALTSRQREVLALVAMGRETGEIASQLALSEATVKNHVAAILAALRCRSRTAAVSLAFRAGLVS